MEDYNEWRGKTVVDVDGNKIGSLGDIYLDEKTEKPTWATVMTGLFGTKSNFFPVALATRDEDDNIIISAPAEHVKEAPRIDADEILNTEEERALYEYYKQDWGEDDDDDDTVGAYSDDDDEDDEDRGTIGHDTSGPTTDDAMTRSEEELHIGTRKQEAGRVRLKKYVVTDHVTKTVPVEREEVRLEREDVTDENRGAATSGPELSEEEHEVVLNEEVPVVDKDVVAKERLRLTKDKVHETHRVDEDVRKERIDVAGDGDEQR